MIVIDASALVELLRGGTSIAIRLADRISRPGESLHAPHVIDLEVLSALRSMEARKQIPHAVATTAVSDLLAVDLARHGHDLLAPRIWQLRTNLTAYDASYIALAELLASPIITCDAKLAAAPGNRARIELFA
jgi:predicted nucleic acid-binding protein